MEISGAALFRTRPAAIRSPAGKKAIVILSLAAALIVAAFLTPPAAFSIDDVIYIDMARAMAERGSLDITDQNIPAGAPALTKSAGIVHLIDGRAVPQYPAGYGLIAAPFFGLFGVSGLILMNALAGALSLWLTYKIAFRLYRDDRIAANAALILGACTLFAGYVLAIWPHMTALACLLGGAYFALETSIETGRRRMMAALAGGFIFGFGVFFRVDALVPFAAAFFWLRLFALPSSRAPALLFLAGAAPCFLLAAYFNFEKFGAFLPVTYGPNMSGNSSLGAYGPLAVAGLAAMAASLVLDTSHKFIQSVLGCSMRVKLIALTGVMLAGLVLAGDVIGRLLHSLYFLTVDIQAYDAASPQTGLGRDEFGYWSFWGLPKKALLQSLPFAALALLPALAFCRGKNARAHALALMMLAAPILFYSLKAWHGGMALNMRYFLPAVPFIAILAAHGLDRFRIICAARPKALPRSIVGGAAAAVVLYQLLPPQIERFATPLQMYPQLILFAALLIALAAHLRAPMSLPRGLAACVLSGASLGYAGALSLSDMVAYLGVRADHASYERLYENAFRPGALVITAAEDTLVHASLNGVHVARAADKNRRDIDTAIDAYGADNRCVYAHTNWAADIIGRDRLQPVETPGLSHGDERLALFTLKARREACQIIMPSDR